MGSLHEPNLAPAENNLITGIGGVPTPLTSLQVAPSAAPGNYGGALLDALNDSSPDYQGGLQLNLSLRNRVAKSDQYRAELEYGQEQVYAEELKKNIAIEVRSASYAVAQNASGVAAARKGFEAAQGNWMSCNKKNNSG